MPSFNGDIYIADEFRKIVKQFDIKTIIETGTHNGNTTIELAKMAKNVITIEKNDTYFRFADNKLKNVDNVRLLLGSSPESLKHILNVSEKPILFYLDAHWYSYNPLIDELKVIKKMGLKPCIAIHDFKVPNRDDLGFDKFPDGSNYEFSNIKKYVDSIYGKNNYNYYYNDKNAGGSMRGVIYIVPKVDDE